MAAMERRQILSLLVKKRSAHPILISREVYNFYCNDGHRTLNTLSELNIQKAEAILDDDLVGAV